MAGIEDYTDHTIQAWLQEPIQLPEEGRVRVAERIRQTPQHRHRWPIFPTRSSHAMLSATQLVVAGVLFALLGGVALLGFVGMPTDEPWVPPAAASPVSSAEPTAAPTAEPSPAVPEDAEATYEATGRLIVDPGPNPSLQHIATAADMAQRYAERARSERVIRAVLDELGLDESVSGLQSRVSTDVAEDTGELVVTVRDSEPIAAQQVALAIGADLRQRVRDELITDEVREAEADIAATESLIRALQNRLNKLQNKSPKTAADRAEMLALMGQLSDLRRTKQDLAPSSRSGVRYLLEWTERPTISQQPTPAQGPDVVDPSPAPLDVNGNAYEATGRLIVDPGSYPSAQHIAVAESLAQRYAERASSSRVVRAVLDELGLEMSVGDLQGRLVTGVTDGTAEVVITVRDSEPVAAEQIALAVGAELRQRVRDELITSEVREAEADIAATEALIKSTQNRLNQLRNKRPKDEADRAEILALTGQLSDLRRTRQALEPFSRSGVRYLLEWSEKPLVAGVFGSGRAHEAVGQAQDDVVAGQEPGQIAVQLAGVREDKPSYYADDCHVEAYDDKELRTNCVYGNPQGKTKAMLIGDAQAAQWFPALDAYAAEKGWSLEVHTKGACPVIDVPVWERDLRRLLTECVDWRQDLLKRIRKTEPDIVFVGLSRDYELFDGRVIRSRDALDYWQAQLTDLLTRLDKRADRVVLLGETPSLTFDPVDCLADPDVGTSDPSQCDAPKWLVMDDDYATLERRAANNAGAELLSINDIVCPGDTCPVLVSDDTGSHVVFRDEHHITASYMERLAEAIGRRVEASDPRHGAD